MPPSKRRSRCSATSSSNAAVRLGSAMPCCAKSSKNESTAAVYLALVRGWTRSVESDPSERLDAAREAMVAPVVTRRRTILKERPLDCRRS